MDYSTKYLNIISKNQKVLEFFALLIIFTAVGFRFGSEGSEWFWTGQEVVPLILGISALVFGIFGSGGQKSKLKQMQECRNQLNVYSIAPGAVAD